MLTECELVTGTDAKHGLVRISVIMELDAGCGKEAPMFARKVADRDGKDTVSVIIAIECFLFEYNAPTPMLVELPGVLDAEHMASLAMTVRLLFSDNAGDKRNVIVRQVMPAFLSSIANAADNNERERCAEGKDRILHCCG